MNEFDFIRWLVNIVAAAHADKAAGKRRFGDDFPMKKQPKTFFSQYAVVTLAAQIYNVAYEGWEE
jgi:hypothetical protein